FAGTTCSSDSPPPYMLAFRLVAFSSRSGVLLPDTDGVSRFSRMEFPDMPGVSDCAGSINGSPLSPSLILPSASQNILVQKLFPGLQTEYSVIDPDGRVSHPFRTWTFGRVLSELEEAARK